MAELAEKVREKKDQYVKMLIGLGLEEKESEKFVTNLFLSALRSSDSRDVIARTLRALLKEESS